MAGKAPSRRVVLCLLLLVGARVPAQGVTFDWFDYTGRDAAFAEPLPAGHYRNPILAGFYPDPSVTRVGDKFYLVNSTFTYFPGIPVFESADLVHWRQIGNVIDRPTQLNFDGLSVSRGVFAPSIHYHDGTFYVLNTAVDSGGNFFVTAANAAGPWSDPHWLPIDGIDPAFFFDGDKAFVLNNGPPEGTPLYKGHRAIWIQEFDVAQGRLIGPRKVLVDGGVDISQKPIWIEGPHLFKRGGWYYLSCAEGGTGPNHSQVVLRSRSPWGPFVAFAGNPILTQRDLPAGRDKPVTNAGHAQLVEAPDGTWRATFLASRSYEDVYYNTGRETFLLPVAWRDDWPVILERGRAIPYAMKGPAFSRGTDQSPLTGNFTWRDEFDSAELDRAWLQVRVPKQPWFDLRSTPGRLTIRALVTGLDDLTNPSFLARRQQHQAFDATTSFDVPPTAGVAAGIAAFQSERFWYFFGARRAGDRLELFIEKKGGGAVATVATRTIDMPARPLQLRISGDARLYSFSYSTDGCDWSPLLRNDDGSILSTKVADGFVGATIGPYARSK